MHGVQGLGHEKLKTTDSDLQKGMLEMVDALMADNDTLLKAAQAMQADMVWFAYMLGYRPA